MEKNTQQKITYWTKLEKNKHIVNMLKKLNNDGYEIKQVLPTNYSNGALTSAVIIYE